MPKAEQVEGRELHDADVQFVSIVKRPANRTPFRILKSAHTEAQGEPKMFDLSMGISRMFKGEPATKPVIACVLVAKTADLAAAKAKITAAGLSIAKAEDV